MERLDGWEASSLGRIPDAERRLPHWSAPPQRLPALGLLIPDAERRLPHWSGTDARGLPLFAPIPDAERRLPHWSPVAGDIAGWINKRFQTPKGVCLIGARRHAANGDVVELIPDAERRLPHWSAGRDAAVPRARRIPDAERRLPHWSVVAPFADSRELENSRRRKASASLEHVSGRGLHRRPAVFQTPKGVCLIGAPQLQPFPARHGLFQTPKGVCLIGADGVGVRADSLALIPDAERRLPHWSNVCGRLGDQHPRIPDAERRLPHWSLGGLAAVGGPVGIGFQTPKGVCLIGARGFAD